MAHTFKITGTITIERISGKFAEREEMAQAIRDGLESAEGDIDVEGLGPDGDSQYEITGFDLTVD